jgi:hypothetical protein
MVWPLVVVVPGAFAIQFGMAFFLPFFLLLLLCASLMSRLTLDVILLHKLGVIDVCLILIYFSYKNMTYINNKIF